MRGRIGSAGHVTRFSGCKPWHVKQLQQSDCRTVTLGGLQQGSNWPQASKVRSIRIRSFPRIVLVFVVISHTQIEYTALLAKALFFQATLLL